MTIGSDYVGKHYKGRKISEIICRASQREFLILLDDDSTFLLRTEAEIKQFAADVIGGDYDGCA